MNSLVSQTSRMLTAVGELFGTSTPIAALPGIGASTRTWEAARFMAMLSASAVIRATLNLVAGDGGARRDLDDVRIDPELLERALQRLDILLHLLLAALRLVD